MNNLRLYLGLFAALFLFSSGFYVCNLIWENRSRELLDEQEKLLIGQCKDQKKITKEIDNENLKKMRARDARLAEYKRLHPAPSCVPVARTPGYSDAASGGNIDGGPHAVADYALVDYAAIAERYRVQLVGCQEFIIRVWETQ